MNCLLSRQQLETVVEPVRAGLTRFIHRTLPLDEQIWEEYAKDYLGGGLEGHVYSQRCVATKTYRAVKSIVIKSNPMEKEAQRKGFDMFIKIAEITKDSDHLVRFYGWVRSEEMNRYYIAMEYFPLGDLSSYMHTRGRKFGEDEVLLIIEQLLQALKKLHETGIAHRDLKPHNILVASEGPQWEVKVADFGLSKQALSQNSGLKTKVGSREYMAPEILEREDEKYDTKVDIWSLGIITIELLQGERPATNLSKLNAPNGVRNIRWPKLQGGVEEIYARMLTELPRDRPTAEYIWDCLQRRAKSPTCILGAQQAITQHPGHGFPDHNARTINIPHPAFSKVEQWLNDHSRSTLLIIGYRREETWLTLASHVVHEISRKGYALMSFYFRPSNTRPLDQMLSLVSTLICQLAAHNKEQLSNQPSELPQDFPAALFQLRAQLSSIPGTIYGVFYDLQEFVDPDTSQESLLSTFLEAILLNIGSTKLKMLFITTSVDSRFRKHIKSDDTLIHQGARSTVNVSILKLSDV